jgi:hypothetical protein
MQCIVPVPMHSVKREPCALETARVWFRSGSRTCGSNRIVPRGMRVHKMLHFCRLENTRGVST